MAIAGWSRGLAARGGGRPDEAHVHLSEVVGRDIRSSHPMVAMAATGDIVEAAVAVGDEETAASAMAALEHLAVGTGQPWACAVLARCRAWTCPTGGERQFAAALRHHADGSRPFEHGRTLLAYGARLVLTDPERRMLAAIEEAERIRDATGAWMANQFANPANPRIHYETTAPELWQQLDARMDAFVYGSGTGGTISGVGRFLRERSPGTIVVAVEPPQEGCVHVRRSPAKQVLAVAERGDAFGEEHRSEAADAQVEARGREAV